MSCLPSPIIYYVACMYSSILVQYLLYLAFCLSPPVSTFLVNKGATYTTCELAYVYLNEFQLQVFFRLSYIFSIEPISFQRENILYYVRVVSWSEWKICTGKRDLGILILPSSPSLMMTARDVQDLTLEVASAYGSRVKRMTLQYIFFLPPRPQLSDSGVGSTCQRATTRCLDAAPYSTVVLFM